MICYIIMRKYLVIGERSDNAHLNNSVDISTENRIN